MPNTAEIYDTRGNAYEHKGEHDLAIADYTKAISLKPNLVETYINRRKAYEHMGDYDRAIADFKRAKELNRTKTQK